MCWSILVFLIDMLFFEVLYEVCICAIVDEDIIVWEVVISVLGILVGIKKESEVLE